MRITSTLTLIITLLASCQVETPESRIFQMVRDYEQQRGNVKLDLGMEEVSIQQTGVLTTQDSARTMENQIHHLMELDYVDTAYIQTKYADFWSLYQDFSSRNDTLRKFYRVTYTMDDPIRPGKRAEVVNNYIFSADESRVIRRN